MDTKDLEVYQLAFELSTVVWNIISKWDEFSRKSIGIQLIRSADSIGANIAEGFGRFHFKDNKLFCYYARGSLEETKHWLRLAYKRKILSKEDFDSVSPLMDKLPPKLNSYIKSIGEKNDDNTSDE